MAGKPLKERDCYPGRQALNQHLHRHHGGLTLSGDVPTRLAAHDELHWEARQAGTDLGHTHLPYQDGETDNDMARRMLADGTAAQQTSE
jgi:hypothetical protein